MGFIFISFLGTVYYEFYAVLTYNNLRANLIRLMSGRRRTYIHYIHAYNNTLTIWYLISRSCSALWYRNLAYLWFSFDISNEDGRGHDIKLGNTLFHIRRN